MTDWKLKSCPKCGGDLYIDSDHHGWYEQCLQCGYMAELKEIAEFQKQRAVKEKEQVRAAPRQWMH